MVLGAEDNGEVTGHRYPADAVTEILRVPETRLKPPLRPGTTVALDAHELLVCEVAPAPRAVMVVGDGFPRREGDEVIYSSEEAINRLKDGGLVSSPEARLAERASASDLDPGLVRRAMTAAGFEGEPETYLVQRRLAQRAGLSAA